MAVGLVKPDHLLPVPGVELAAVAAGIKKSATKNDLVLFQFSEDTRVAAVFTRNQFCAAPVTLCKQHLAITDPRYLVINSGNANAGTGQQGMQDAQQVCRWVAQVASVTPEAVLPFSTGVIGEYLPLDRFEAAIPSLAEALSEDHWLEAARGIMTTDTIEKGVSRRFDVEGIPVTITGIAKGSGMIRPDMATMLAFVATDAVIAKDALQQMITDAVNLSFNAITVDGDTSTNDACVLAATGKAGNTEITLATDRYTVFATELVALFQELAQSIIRDGEGATRFITIQVDGADTLEQARQVAYTIAHSPLVKTACFAGDPNWGRILAAVGRAGVPLDMAALKIYLDDVCIVEDGGRASDYTEAAGDAVMKKPEFTIRVDLSQGNQSAAIWTSDLSYDYVKINAEYRS